MGKKLLKYKRMGFGGPELDLYRKQTKENVVFPEYYETKNPRAGMTF